MSLRYRIRRIFFSLLNSKYGNLARKAYHFWSGLQRNRLVANYFKSDAPKRALLCGLIEPFVSGVSNHHTFHLESYLTAEVLHEMGYQVDVINWSATRRIKYANYHLIYGFGKPLERFFYERPDLIDSTITITNSPGSSTNFSNHNGIRKLLLNYQKTGRYFVHSLRLAEFYFYCQRTLSDATIVLGNAAAVETYADLPMRGHLYALPSFFHKTTTPDLSGKDYSAARRHFLWFGSIGLLHKGLDLLLPIFKRNPVLHLHVCGAISLENEFGTYYAQELRNTETIHVHGFVQIDSPEFAAILNQCAWCVLPSISEGGSPSVLTTVGNGGLVPILSRACSVDLGDHAYLIDEYQEEAVEELLTELAGMDADTLRMRAIAAYEFVNANYTPARYKANTNAIFRRIVAAKHAGTSATDQPNPLLRQI